MGFVHLEVPPAFLTYVIRLAFFLFNILRPWAVHCSFNRSEAIATETQTLIFVYVNLSANGPKNDKMADFI